MKKVVASMMPPVKKATLCGAWALFIVSFLAHLAYAVWIRTPLIHGDESGYLMNAAALVGYRTAAYSSYYSGYSLLLTPAFLVSSSPTVIFQVVHVINAFAWSMCALIVRSLFLTLDDGERARRLELGFLVGLAVTLYPSFMVFGSLAVSENIFVLDGLIAGWLLSRLIRAGSWRDGFALMVVAGFAFLIHPKGIAIFIAAAVAVSVLLKTRRQKIIHWLIVVPSVIVLLALLHHGERLFMKSALEVGRVDLVGHYPSIKDFIGKTVNELSPGFLLHLIISFLGQLFYLFAASLGLVYLGVAWCLRKLRADVDRGHRAYAVFTLIAVLLTMGISVLTMVHGDRADHVVYGRYNEGVIALLLIPSFLALERWKSYLPLFSLACIFLIAVAYAKGFVLKGAVVLTNIAGIGAIVQLLGKIDLAYVFVYFAVSVIVIVSAARLSSRWSVSAVIAMFTAQSTIVLWSFLIPGSSFRNQQHSLADYVKEHFPDMPCVNYDERATGFWEKYNYMFFFLPKSLRAVAEPYQDLCSPLLVSASGHVEKVLSHAVPLRQEKYSSEELWLVTSRLHGQVPVDFGFTWSSSVKNIIVNDRHSKDLGALLGGGWYPLEPWGVWSSADGYLIFRRPTSGERSTVTRLTARVFGASASQSKTLIVSVDGKDLRRLTLVDDKPFNIDLNISPAEVGEDTEQHGLMVVKLSVPDAESPSEVNMSADRRKLGVGLLEIAKLDK